MEIIKLRTRDITDLKYTEGFCINYWTGKYENMKTLALKWKIKVENAGNIQQIMKHLWKDLMITFLFPSFYLTVECSSIFSFYFIKILLKTISLLIASMVKLKQDQTLHTLTDVWTVIPSFLLPV